MEDAVQLSRRQEKARRARVREEARNAELRAAGLAPLIVHRSDANAVDDALPDDDEDLVEVGESRKEVSWIWTLAGTAGVDEQELENGASHITLHITLSSLYFDYCI